MPDRLTSPFWANLVVSVVDQFVGPLSSSLRDVSVFLVFPPASDLNQVSRTYRACERLDVGAKPTHFDMVYDLSMCCQGTGPQGLIAISPRWEDGEGFELLAALEHAKEVIGVVVHGVFQ